MTLGTRIQRIATVGCLALALIIGFGSGLQPQHASAAKYVAINCDQLYSSALYAGGQYLAASRRGDSITADFWWSIYNSLELSYARNCMGGSAI